MTAIIISIICTFILGSICGIGAACCLQAKNVSKWECILSESQKKFDLLENEYKLLQSLHEQYIWQQKSIR